MTRDDMLTLVCEATAGALGLPEPVHPGVAFTEYGLDSLAGIELRDKLQTALGVQLPANVTTDYPTAEQLTAHLLTVVK